MDYPAIRAIVPAPVEFAYDDRFTMLYALALGCGVDRDELDFVYERRLRTMPTMAVVMAGAAGEVIAGGKLDFTRIVHGEQRLIVHRPLPPTGRVVSQARCIGVADKGAGKGALVSIEATMRDAADGGRLATATMTLFCRGDGGCGGDTAGVPPLPASPDRAPDAEVALATLPQQAALYRLLGDRNPLHIDPELSSGVGFDRPILHGLCTYGIACRAVLRACAGGDPARIAQFDARFAAAVLPGDTIVTHIWQDGSEVWFECLVAQDRRTVISNGYCRLSNATELTGPRANTVAVLAGYQPLEVQQA